MDRKKITKKPSPSKPQNKVTPLRSLPRLEGSASESAPDHCPGRPVRHEDVNRILGAGKSWEKQALSGASRNLGEILESLGKVNGKICFLRRTYECAFGLDEDSATPAQIGFSDILETIQDHISSLTRDLVVHEGFADNSFEASIEDARTGLKMVREGAPRNPLKDLDEIVNRLDALLSRFQEIVELKNVAAFYIKEFESMGWKR